MITLSLERGAMHWLTSVLPHWDAVGGARQMLVRRMQAWLVAAHLPGISFQDKPILTLVGPKQSGKTTLLRVLLRLVYGPKAGEYIPISSIDKIVSIPTNRPMWREHGDGQYPQVLALDLAPSLFDCLGDDLSPAISLAREAHLSGRVADTWIACACSPSHPLLSHPDMADRLLVLPLAEIPRRAWISEASLLRQADVHHISWWAEVVIKAGMVAEAMQRGEIAPRPVLDFPTLEAIANYLGERF